ncbi:hypothetical protein ABIC27_002243 [Streptomyces sp. PvR034]
MSAAAARGWRRAGPGGPGDVQRVLPEQDRYDVHFVDRP